MKEYIKKGYNKVFCQKIQKIVNLSQNYEFILIIPNFTCHHLITHTCTYDLLKYLLQVKIKVAEHSFAGRQCVFLIRQTHMAAKKAMVHRKRQLKLYSLKFCGIWQNFYFYRIFNNENVKMEVEQTNFVTHLIITVKLYYYLKSRLLKFGQISFKW